MIGTTGPSFNCIVGNSFTEVKGKEQLKIYKTRENAKATMFVAECCKACVAMPHETQEGICFICPADVCIIKSNDEISHEETQARMWTDEFKKDFDPNCGELPPYTGRGEILPKLTPAKMLFSKLMPIMIKRTGIKPVRLVGDTCLEELTAEIEKMHGPPTNLGLDPMFHPQK